MGSADDRSEPPGNGPWEHHNPVPVAFGRGVRKRVVQAVAGARCLVVTSPRGRRQVAADPWLHALDREDTVWADRVSGNPDLAELQAAVDDLGAVPVDAVIGVGGGSALDTAKVLALAVSPGGRGTPVRDLVADPPARTATTPLPLHALPTTAGTGSEVTPFATVWDHQRRRKHSLAGAAVFPSAAWVDPELADGLPPAVIVATGLDAVNQAAESVWNRNATPVTLTLAHRALELGFSALPRLAQGRAAAADRDRMAECSLLAGMAISQTRTALCHSISYPITVHFGVPHGVACAFTAPAVLRHCLAGDDGRFADLARALLGPAATVDDLVAAFEALNRQCGVREAVLEKAGGTAALQALAPGMDTPGRAANALVPADEAAIVAILGAAAEGG